MMPDPLQLGSSLHGDPLGMISIFIFSFLLDFVINGIVANCWIAVFLAEGFSIANAATACGFMCLSTALFELPTGYIADRFLGRKGSTITGIVLTILGLALLSISVNPLSSKISMVIVGLGTTFISGAKQSWIRNVVTDKYPHKLKRLFFDLDIGGRFSTIIGVWIGAYLIQYSSSNNVWILGSFVSITALMFGFSIPKGRSDHLSLMKDVQYFSKDIIGILKFPTIGLFLIATLFFGIEDGTRSIIFQPTIMNLSSGNALILAYQASITFIPRIAGSFIYRNFLLNSPKQINYLLGSALIIGVIEILISMVNSYTLFAAGWSMAVFLFGIFLPLKETFFHKLIDDSNAENWRATLVSIESLISNLSQATVCFWLAKTIQKDYAQSYFFVGGLALITTAFMYLISSFNRKGVLTIQKSL